MAKIEELKGGDAHFPLHLSSPSSPFSLHTPFSLVTHFISSLHCPVDPGSREIMWDIWILGYLIFQYFNISPIFELGRAV